MDVKKEIKVMIVGDFMIFRSGLKMLLDAEENIKFVGEGATLSEAAESIRKIKPDILLIDSTEIDDAARSAQFFADQPNGVSLIVLTNSTDAETQRKYLLLGIDGVVSKQETTDILFKAIRQIHDGDVYFNRRLMCETIKHLVGEMKLIPEKLYTYNCAALTEREREVLTLVCRGMKNRIIADHLFITETTVRHHLTSIFEKLKVSSRLELVVYAFRQKLVEIPLEQADYAASF